MLEKVKVSPVDGGASSDDVFCHFPITLSVGGIAKKRQNNTRFIKIIKTYLGSFKIVS